MGGCVSSVGEDVSKSNMTRPAAEPCAEDRHAAGASVLNHGHNELAVNDGGSSRKRIKGNQVAPEPCQRPRCAETLIVQVPSVRTASSPVQTKWGTGTNWDQREISPRAWPAFIQELQQWAHLVKGDRSHVLGPGKAERLRGLGQEAAAWLDVAGAASATTASSPQRRAAAALPFGEAAAMIEACAVSAAQIADAALRPILSQVERMLTNGAASSSLASSGRGGGAKWDTLEVDELVSALQAASEAELDTSLDRATAVARSAAEMLLMLLEHSLDPRLRAHPSNCVVSASLERFGVTLYDG